jgi:SAM-dependent methyltransferase
MRQTNQMELAAAWDDAAGVLDHEPSRCLRYAKCFRYVRNHDRRLRVLEIGCGEGTGLAIAAGMGFTNLVGVEVSKSRLDAARAKVTRDVDLVLVGLDCRLPFADASFDIVISAAVIEHVIDPRMFMLEVSRVLRDGGCAVISSDCWQWQVLNWLGLYRSVQPIDRAFFPTTFLRLFRGAGLQLFHAEAFVINGEYIFLKAVSAPVIEALRRNRLSYVIGRSIRRTLAALKPERPAPLPTPQTSPNGSAGLRERFERIMAEPLPRQPWPMTGFYLLFSDENVFAMRRPPRTVGLQSR